MYVLDVFNFNPINNTGNDIVSAVLFSVLLCVTSIQKCVNM